MKNDAEKSYEGFCVCGALAQCMMLCDVAESGQHEHHGESGLRLDYCALCGRLLEHGSGAVVGVVADYSL